MSAFRTKPVTFDLALTLCISLYLNFLIFVVKGPKGLADHFNTGAQRMWKLLSRPGYVPGWSPEPRRALS